MTSVQAVGVADDADSQPTPSDFDCIISLSHQLRYNGFFPAIDPLRSRSRILDEKILGLSHVDCALNVQDILRRLIHLKELVTIVGAHELSEQDKLAMMRGRKIQKFLTQAPGVKVDMETLISDIKEIISGKHDKVPEPAFFMAGDMASVLEKAKKMSS
jgi:F-type H+-transporting ATPase subunit beta